MPDFDPDKYLAGKERAFDPDLYLTSKEAAATPEQAPGLGQKALSGIAAVGRGMESYGGAPARAAIGKLQENMFDLPSAGRAFREQLGADPSLAPTGRQLAERTGLSGRAAGIAGFGLEMAADPLAFVPIGKLAKYGGKAAGKLAEAATGATRLQAQRFVPGTGKRLLEEGVVGAFSSPKGIAARARARMAKSGAGIGSALKTLEKKGAPKISRQDLGLKMLERAEALKNSDDAISRMTGEALENVSDNFLKGKSLELSLTAIEKEKKALAKLGRYDRRNITVPVAQQEAYKEASKVLRETTEDVASRIDPSIAKKFKKEKELFQVLSPVEKASSIRAIQLQQHPLGGFLDVTTGLGGLAAGGLPGAIIAPAVRKMVAPRIAGTLAAGLRRGKQISPIAKPAYLGTVATGRIAPTAKENREKVITKLQGTKFSEPLRLAAERGDDSFASTYYLLSQTHPEFRAALEDGEEE